MHTYFLRGSDAHRNIVHEEREKTRASTSGPVVPDQSVLDRTINCLWSERHTQCSKPYRVQCYRLFAIQPIPEAASTQQNKKKNADKTTDSRRRNRNKEEEREREDKKRSTQATHGQKQKRENQTQQQQQRKPSRAEQHGTASSGGDGRRSTAEVSKLQGQGAKAFCIRDSVLSTVLMGLCSGQQTEPQLGGV